MKQTLANIFQTINSTNSVSKKEAILREHKDNEQLKKLLVFALSPYKLFQFNKMPLSGGGLTNYETANMIGVSIMARQRWEEAAQC